MSQMVYLPSLGTKSVTIILLQRAELFQHVDVASKSLTPRPQRGRIFTQSHPDACFFLMGYMKPCRQHSPPQHSTRRSSNTITHATASFGQLTPSSEPTFLTCIFRRHLSSPHEEKHGPKKKKKRKLRIFLCQLSDKPREESEAHKAFSLLSSIQEHFVNTTLTPAAVVTAPAPNQDVA